VIMRTRHMPALLRTHRRNWGLTQRDMADLLGFESPAHVSRIEQGKRTPSTETALACTALFGVSLQELFPQLAAEIEERFKDRALRLHQGLTHPTTPTAARKRQLLDQTLGRSAREINLAAI
jgi:transcriptional regulator with XRE-family HTH domain